jgi:hypothetical protein
MFTDRAFRMARLWSNHELRQIAGVFTGDVVNVSAWDDRDKAGARYRDYFSSATAYFTTNYSGERGLQQQPNEYFLDLTGDVPAELRQRFDVAFNHTTLEHVFEVRKAFRNLCNLSRDVVIVIVPFAQVQHENSSFGDFWRFTPTCLRRLFDENGLNVIYEAENRDRNAATYLLFVGSRHPERWQNRLPEFAPLERSASWIGATPVRDAVVSLFTGKWHRLWKPPQRDAA